jgi:arsenate reductase
MPDKTNILFLCTHNANRSQMAEGWTRHLMAAKLEAYSAGVEPTSVDPLAIEVMKEAGVDISEQASKSADVLSDIEFDYVVTLCSGAAENCPYFPARTKVIHRGFDDPPGQAAGETTEEGKLKHYRRIRDEIRGFIESLPASLE